MNEEKALEYGEKGLPFANNEHEELDLISGNLTNVS